MYKTRNTGTGKGMRGTRGIGGMLYSREYRQTFWGMSPNSPWNVDKHSGECREIFHGMSPNITGNIIKRFPGMPTTGWHSNSTVGRAPKH